MEKTATEKRRTVRGEKKTVHCTICGSVVGKSGQGSAEFRCPKCKLDIEVDFKHLTLQTTTMLREA